MRGRTDEPLLEETVGQCLDRTAKASRWQPTPRQMHGCQCSAMPLHDLKLQVARSAEMTCSVRQHHRPSVHCVPTLPRPALPACPAGLSRQRCAGQPAPGAAPHLPPAPPAGGGGSSRPAGTGRAGKPLIWRCWWLVAAAVQLRAASIGWLVAGCHPQCCIGVANACTRTFPLPIASCAEGGPSGHLGPQLRRVGGAAVCHSQGRGHSGERRSRSLAGWLAGIRLCRAGASEHRHCGPHAAGQAKANSRMHRMLCCISCPRR